MVRALKINLKGKAFLAHLSSAGLRDNISSSASSYYTLAHALIMVEIIQGKALEIRMGKE